MMNRMAGGGADRGGMALLLLLVLLTGGCAHRRPVPPADASGFLDDYTLLREGGANELHLVYRNPKADWHAYAGVLLEPVTLWRSGRKSLEPVPQEDLLRLVTDFQSAVRGQLERDFRFVDQPGPGVMRIRLAITDAHASDPVLDVLTASRGSGRPHPAGAGALHPETRRFLESAAIEGDIRDSQTNTLLAEGVDRRRREIPASETWGEVDHAFTVWAERMSARLETRTGAR
jgi:Protein of unknown function (DUF3313)